MPRSTSLIRRVSALALAVAVVSVSCSGSDNDDATTDDAADTTVEASTEPGTDAADDSADESDPDVRATGELELSGALTASITEADDDVAFRAGGGCFDGAFQMSVKVDVDGRTRYDMIVPDLTGIDGDTTGEFTTDVELHYYDPDVAGFEPEVFAGSAAVTIVGQDADVRAFDYEVAGSLTSEDDPTRVVDVDFAYSAPIICA